MVPAEYRALPNYLDLVQVGASMHLRLNHQDYMVDGSLQRATRSRFFPRGPYAWQEEIVALFDDWVARRCAPSASRGEAAAGEAATVERR
jgi:hypothetical protein